MRLIGKIGAVVAVTVLAGAGVAYASIPDRSGVIHACYSKSATRITDGKCKSGEKALAWNQSGPQGPAGPAGTGAAPETRVGHCVTKLAPNTPAGTYVFTCTYRKPFTDPCGYPEVVVTPATLSELDTDDTRRWFPGTDYYYWLTGLQGGSESCEANTTSFHLNVKTLHKVPSDLGVAMGFTYTAGILMNG